MSLVVDASVAIKWFVNENGHEDALSTIDLKTELVAPDLFKAEFTNVLWKKVQRSEVELEHAMLAIERVESFLTFLPASFEAAQSALRFAVTLNHSSYDCVYLACAERLGAKLVTADIKFADKIDKAGLSHLVMRLGDAKPAKFQKAVISDEDLQKVLALSGRYIETVDSVYTQLQPTAGRMSFVKMADMTPALDSPVRRNLMAALIGLSDVELTDLIALGWLGRGYDGTDFLALRDQARATFSDGPSNHLPYVVSLLRHVENGLALLSADRRTD